jgi:hypothetical protein
VVVASAETSPDHRNDVTATMAPPEPEIPEELQKELDTPVKEYRAPSLAKRSRVFGSTSTAFPTLLPRLPPRQPSDPSDPFTLRLSPLDDTPTILTALKRTPARKETTPTLENDEVPSPTGVGHVIRMAAFNLGPTIEVPAEQCLPFRHPASPGKLGLLTCRESSHQFLPRRPGHHGILYLDRTDLPKYIVRPFPLSPVPCTHNLSFPHPVLQCV